MFNVKKSFEKIAYDFDKTRNKVWEEVLNFISDLKENSIIVDLGCGNLRNSLAISKMEKNKKLKFICMDISKSMIKISKNKIVNENNNHKFFFLLANGKEIPLKEKLVDRVIVIAVFHHLTKKDTENFAREIHRILKENGKFLLSVWKKDQIMSKKHEKISEDEVITFWGKNKVPIYYRIVSKQELENVFRDMFSKTCIWEDNWNIWLEGKK